MDPQQKKAALRMIPYGLYVLASETSDGQVAAATVNWVTQAAFEPPLVAVGVKADSTAHEVIKKAGHFALSVLGKGQQDVAFAFFKSVQRQGELIGGQAFERGALGSPVLASAPAHIECQLVASVEKGDHSIFVGEVRDARVRTAPPGRPDDVTLALRDLGEKTFYGG